MAAKRIARVALGGILASAVVFGGITLYALESSDVAVVETRRAAGGTRSTHVWYVEAQDGLWLEAGTPENGWFVDVQAEPRLRFAAGGRSGTFLAEPAGPEAHARLRERLRAKYGWRDAWVSIYVDSTRSRAVRLVPAP
jgi:hypothetical protein